MAVRTNPAGGNALPGWLRSRPGSDPDTVHLTIAEPAVTPDAVRACCDALAGAGYTRAVTNALAPRAAAGLLAAGFTLHEELVVFTRPLVDLPAVGGRTRRAWRLGPLVALDRRSFGPRAFDLPALRDARRATPVALVRLVGRARAPLGYAITGLAGYHAYVQRLAVDPAARGRRLGLRLLLDGLHRARRRGACIATVNTHADNAPARSLYESTGFSVASEGLWVLACSLDSRPVTGAR